MVGAGGFTGQGAQKMVKQISVRIRLLCVMLGPGAIPGKGFVVRRG